jgi:hypothetical protein
MPFNVSQSKVNAWRQCKMKFHLQHREHLKRRVPPRPLKFGSMIHKMMETQAQGKNAFKLLDEIALHDFTLFNEEREMYGEIIDDIRYIFKAYIEYWKKTPLKFIKIKDKTVEVPFEIELTSEINVKGTIDGGVRYKGFRALLEHKTHKNFPNDDHRWRNLQSAVYLRILEMMGYGTWDGTLWNYIRSKPPTRPKVTQGGALSRAAIDTLPDVVIDTLKANKMKLADYADYIMVQQSNLQTWFQRTYTPIQPDVIKMLFGDFIRTAREMSDYYDTNPKKSPVRTIAKHCDWCQYEPLCRAEIQGNDVDFVREHEFVYDESEYQTEGEYDTD